MSRPQTSNFLTLDDCIHSPSYRITDDQTYTTRHITTCITQNLLCEHSYTVVRRLDYWASPNPLTYSRSAAANAHTWDSTHDELPTNRTTHYQPPLRTRRSLSTPYYTLVDRTLRSACVCVWGCGVTCVLSITLLWFLRFASHGPILAIGPCLSSSWLVSLRGSNNNRPYTYARLNTYSMRNRDAMAH